jgi:hypothetical protein
MKFNNHTRRKEKTANGLGGLVAVSKVTNQQNSKPSSKSDAIPSAIKFKQLQHGFEAFRFKLFPLSGDKLYLMSAATGMHRVLSDICEAEFILERLGGHHG